MQRLKSKTVTKNKIIRKFDIQIIQKCHVILYIPVMRDIINELFVKMSRLVTQYDNFKRFIPF